MKYRTIGTDPKTRCEVSVLSLGTMHFGTAADEATSFAILDRYVEACGTFVDTTDNYGFWVGTQGGESEELLGRWRRSRGFGEEIVIATKVGARPLAPGHQLYRQRRRPVGQGDPRGFGTQPGPARHGSAGPAVRAYRGSGGAAG
jgi:aryl-alcohol dehydrogenase-like predicted oxidoreductase